MGIALLVLAVCIVAGLLVSLGTELMLGRSKARMLPGGSVGLGFAIGFGLHLNAALIGVCMVAGLVSWIIYRQWFPKQAED